MKYVFSLQNKTLDVLFRETTAQHFGDENWKPRKITTSCVPTSKNLAISTRLNWRNSMAQKIVETYSLKADIIIMPFFGETDDQWNMHDSSGEDCTHYCLNPFLFQPVFGFLRDVVMKNMTLRT